MNRMLAMQVLSSFLAGGAFISLITLIAERASERVAGIVMMFPTTIVLGFFFLGITSSAEQVAIVNPATLIPLGIVVCSSVTYIYSACFFEKLIAGKRAQIICTLLVSSAVWMIVALPFAIYQYKNLVAGVAGYFLLASTAHFLLNRVKSLHPLLPPSYTRGQILFRAVVTGSIISLVVLFSELLNPFWGGIATMFPAATFAALTTLHYYYQPRQLFHFMRRAPLGSLSLFAYAIAAMAFFPRLGAIGGTLASYGISMIVSFGLLGIMRLTSARK